MSLSRQIEDKAGEKSAACKEPTALYSGNKFPSNDLNELFRRLQQQSKDGGFRLLDAHLRESTVVVQEEISRLPHYIRSQVPHFDSIATLSENGYLRHLGLGPAIETALLIVLQLGLFIRHHEALDKVLDLPDNVATVAGLSLGLFPRAAVAQSTTLAEIVNNGAKCLRVSFRLGVLVSDFSQRLEAPQPDGFQQILAHAVTSITEESLGSELTRFNEELENSERSTSRPVKSIISDGGAAAGISSLMETHHMFQRLRLCTNPRLRTTASSQESLPGSARTHLSDTKSDCKRGLATTR
ncbi:uncharacterized protein BDW70DRAFT_164078 [Aspergillus foveolatus]|uniref:uncharacterized protein n=1 Tax=Aspergillus foveolatus TaxID=210207 RepID=UPI003CCD5623